MTEQKVRGIYVQPDGRFRACMKQNRKDISLGTFDTYEQAVDARRKAESAIGYGCDTAARLMAETGVEWRPMVNFPGYFVSADGRVYSAPRFSANGRFLAQITKTGGYLNVHPVHNQKRMTVRIHRAVLMAFDREPINDKEEAAHLNGDRTDNRIENLKWCTPKENALHKIEHGTQPRGEQMYNAKLSDAEVAAVRARRSEGAKLLSLAHEYGVSESCIRDIIKFRTRVISTGACND
jgi:hypothetical protein